VSEVATFRVGRSLKERMNRLKHINWSEVLRSFVERVVAEEEKKLRPRRDVERMRRAANEMDRLAKLAEASGWTGSEEVARWRRTRYSYSTQA